MSHTLHCDFITPSKKGAVYWWPLIFEVMHQHSLSFADPDPDIQKDLGHYYYYRTGDPSESDGVTAPFRTLWDEISSESSTVLVTFWSLNADPFPLNVTLSQEEKNEYQIRIHMSFEAAELTGLSPEDVKLRLQTVLDVAKGLYRLCKPCTGEMYWDYEGLQYAAWASFGKFPEVPSSERPEIPGPERKLIRQYLPNGDYIHVLNPVPIPEKGGEWHFISLLE
jgi:hypothetical protein